MSTTNGQPQSSSTESQKRKNTESTQDSPESKRARTESRDPRLREENYQKHESEIESMFDNIYDEFSADGFLPTYDKLSKNTKLLDEVKQTTKRLPVQEARKQAVERFYKSQREMENQQKEEKKEETETMDQEEKMRKELKQKVGTMVSKRLSKYFKNGIIKSKDEFKRICRKISKKIVEKETLETLDKPETKKHISDFVSKYLNKKKLTEQTR